MRKYLATIELDNDLGRGKIFTEMNEDNEYVIKVELPDGEDEEPAISPCETMEDVYKDIQAAWGIYVWGLEWLDDGDETTAAVKMYMNPVTGSVATRDEWIYEDATGTHDPVADGEVVEVVQTADGWKEV